MLRTFIEWVIRTPGGLPIAYLVHIGIAILLALILVQFIA